MNIVQVILHLGTFMQTGKDVKKAIEDLIAGHPSPDDLKALLQDVVDLVGAGFINIPGVTSAQLSVVVADIEKVLEIV